MGGIHVSEEVMRAAEARAARGGYGTVGEYIADLVRDDMGEPDVFDAERVFTPERIAELDKAAADVAAGRVFTSEQVDEELARRRTEWTATDDG